MTGKKTILVTGGAGYIGCHAVLELLDRGHEVIVFDNLSSGIRENVDPRAKFILGDLLNPPELDKVFENQIDAVWHFASLKAAGESMLAPQLYADNNITGTINLLNKMLEHGVKKFLFASSAAVYGTPNYLPIDEQHPLQPDNFYGYTKVAVEKMLSWYSELSGLNYCALRCYNVAGYDLKGRITRPERVTANLIPLVMEAANGQRKKIQVFGTDYNTADGTCLRDYIHVNDLIDAFLAAMDYLYEKNKNLTVNIGSGQGFLVLEVIKKAMEITGRRIKYEITGRRAGDPAELCAAADLAKRELNWQTKYSTLPVLLKSMWSVYENQAERPCLLKSPAPWFLPSLSFKFQRKSRPRVNLEPIS